ncbi:MAG: hypothetical protein KKB50_09870, partial [Planctomycetes bacterium]|nr:hypothetical protein [Planctomycetota bacterium]
MSKDNRNHRHTCAICGKPFAHRNLMAGAVVRPAVADEIRRAHPDWSPEQFICHPDLATFRGKYVHSLLESERGELTSLEHDVLRSLREHELLSSNVDA